MPRVQSSSYSDNSDAVVFCNLKLPLYVKSLFAEQANHIMNIIYIMNIINL